MGCCGCNNKASAVTAGIFGMVQSIVGIIFNSFFLNLYGTSLYYVKPKEIDDKLFLLYATYDVREIVTILLIVATVLHSAWLFSSFLLLLANCQTACCCGVRQWVVITSLIIIGDFILPAILIGCTIGEFSNVVSAVTNNIQASYDPYDPDKIQDSYDPDKIQDSYDPDKIQAKFQKAVSELILNYHLYYIILVLSFVKGGIITIIINICLAVFTNRRARDLNTPQPTGYVMMTVPIAVAGQTFPIHQQGHCMPMVHHQPAHLTGYPLTQGFTNPRYPSGEQNQMLTEPYPQQPHAYVQFPNPIPQAQVLDADLLHSETSLNQFHTEKI